MRSRIDTYTVKITELNKILGFRVVGIYPMLSDKPRDWSDVPIIPKSWGAYYLNYGCEYMLLTDGRDTQFHFIKNNRIRHGIDSQYQID